MREKPFILVVAAPSINEAWRVAKDAGIGMPSGAIRHVRNAYGLRGWSTGTPVLAGARGHWPNDFAETLDVMLARGQLRIAQDADINRAAEGL